jgi:hypothetical protein
MADETLCVEGSLQTRGNLVAEEGNWQTRGNPEDGEGNWQMRENQVAAETAKTLRERRQAFVRAFGLEALLEEAQRQAVSGVDGRPVVEPEQRNRHPLEVSHWG